MVGVVGLEPTSFWRLIYSQLGLPIFLHTHSCRLRNPASNYRNDRSAQRDILQDNIETFDEEGIRTLIAILGVLAYQSTCCETRRVYQFHHSSNLAGRVGFEPTVGY